MVGQRPEDVSGNQNTMRVAQEYRRRVGGNWRSIVKTHPMSIRTAGLLLALAGTCHMWGQCYSAQEKPDLSL